MVHRFDASLMLLGQPPFRRHWPRDAHNWISFPKNFNPVKTKTLLQLLQISVCNKHWPLPPAITSQIVNPSKSYHCHPHQYTNRFNGFIA